MNYRGFSSIDGDMLITTSSCIIDICIILYPILLWCQVFLNHSVPLLHGAISHQLGILSMVFTFCFTTMHNLGNLRRSCTADFVVLTPWRSRVTDPGSIKGFVQSIKHIPSYTAVCFTGQHPISTPGPLSNLWMWLLWTYRIRDQFVFFACARRTVVIRLIFAVYIWTCSKINNISKNYQLRGKKKFQFLFCIITIFAGCTKLFLFLLSLPVSWGQPSVIWTSAYQLIKSTEQRLGKSKVLQ